MKRALLFIFMTVCVLGMSACSSKDAMPETSDSASNPVQNTDISNLNGGKIWSEQDIVSMFSLVQETDWEYIDCVLIPDHASDRVGAVLFRNDKEQTSNVAFFDADGYFQQYGTYARMSDEPDFQYLGGGAVTFRLETEDGIIYNYTITISIDDSNVNFKAEDGGGIYTFMKQKQKKQAEKEALDPDANYTEDKGDFEIPVEDEPEETGEEDTEPI